MLVPEQVGYWLECKNRKCGFPARVPVLHQPGGKRKLLAENSPFLLACPICLHVNSYRRRDLQKVRFRTPDPYDAGKLILYSARMGCGRTGCTREVLVFAVGPADVSIACLLQLWKWWTIRERCPRHRFRMPHLKTWWIQQERSLA